MQVYCWVSEGGLYYFGIEFFTLIQKFNKLCEKSFLNSLNQHFHSNFGEDSSFRMNKTSHLSMLITHRLMMDAVQHITSMAMKTLQKNCPKTH